MGYGTIGENSNKNYQEIVEKDFSIYDSANIWQGSFPYKAGDTFPTNSIKQRANRYLTNKNLYKCDYSQVYSNIFNTVDAWRKPLSNFPILQLLPNLPDYREITETNVDLMAAKQPKIDGDFDVDSLNKIISNSNLTLACQSIIRDCICYGNAVKKIVLTNKGLKLVSMPLKCWDVWVSAEDLSEIECNIFFNIFKKDGIEFCEFVSYMKNGTIEKRKFYYRDGTLGEEVEEVQITKFYDGVDLSPIVVFTGYSVNGAVIGEDLYQYWEASIAASIRAFGVILQLLEKTKEVTKVMPASATHKDEVSGATYDTQSDTILYDDLEHPPVVGYYSPDIKVEQAIAIYELALKRLSRDTCLTYSMYDTKDLGSNASGKSLKMSMYKTELRATTFKTSIMGTLKEMVYKIGVFCDIDMDISKLTVTWESGFIQDDSELTSIVNMRNGNIPTLTLEESIAILEDITPTEAKKRAQAILGMVEDKTGTEAILERDKPMSDIELSHTDEEKEEKTEDNIKFSPLEGSDIGAN